MPLPGGAERRREEDRGPLHGEDVYAQVRSALPAGPLFASSRRARPAGWATLAGSVGLPMLLAISLATIAWALPGQGESQALAALGLAGIAAALGASAVWAVAAAARRRALEVEALRADRRALREELTALAHDLRAPLVTAHSYFELLAGEAFGRLPSEAREAAARGKVASERARDLADASLRSALGPADARRPGAGGCDLNALLSDVLAGLALPLATTEADIEVGDLPVAASADREALGRVFSTLVERALQHAQPGPQAAHPGLGPRGRRLREYLRARLGPRHRAARARAPFRPARGSRRRRRRRRARRRPRPGGGAAHPARAGRPRLDRPAGHDGVCVRVALPRPRA